MGVYIFVEDQHFRAYEVITQRHLGLPLRLDRSQVRVQQIGPDDVTTVKGWRTLIAITEKAGHDCIVVVIDQEGYASPDRPAKIRQIRTSFSRICEETQSRYPDRLDQIKMSLVISQSCLECWILADTDAVKRYAAGRHGVHYAPARINNTERYPPEQASAELTRIIRGVDRDMHKQRSRRYEKSTAGDICTYVDPSAARSNNRSLDYFLRQVECQISGCERPQALDPV